jgi:hypothetical protein
MPNPDLRADDLGAAVQAMLGLLLGGNARDARIVMVAASTLAIFRAAMLRLAPRPFTALLPPAGM